MLRDITLGQYYPADSVIHKLDPRVKLFGTLIYIISLFVFKGLPAFILAAIFLVVLIKLSKVPFSYMVKGLKTIVLIMLFAAVFNLFLTPGTKLVSFWIFTITYEGSEKCCCHDGPSDFLNYRNLADDTYHNTKRVDRWSGKSVISIEIYKSTGA